MKVTLFTTCIVDFMAMNVGKATVELLEGLGHEIDYPKKQTCCGQPTYNTGYVEKTKNTMKHFIETFEHAEVIVSPSGSCVSFVKEYPHIFADDKEWKERAEKVAAKTYELSQFLIEVINIEDFSAKLPWKGCLPPQLPYIKIFTSERTAIKTSFESRRSRISRFPQFGQVLRVWWYLLC